jgi:hypothetical protein
MAHDNESGEKLAGWSHVLFTGMYVVAAIWHFKSALEHWSRMPDTKEENND